MKRYKEYKDSGVEWIGEIPTHWEKSKIKYVSSIFGRIGFRGYTVEDIVDEGEGAITLSPSNILNQRLVLDKKTYLSWKKYEESPEIKIYNGDVIFVKTASVGKVAYVENLEEGTTLNPQLIVFKNLKINNKYLYYNLISNVIQSEINKGASGSVLQTLTQNEIGNYELMIPPNNEQAKIVDYLDKKTSQIETLISKKEELIETLQDSRTKLISETVTKGLDKDVPMKDSGVEWIGEIPSHWKCNLFKRVIKDIKDGTHGTHPRVDEGEYLLSAKNLNNNYIEINESDSRIPYKDYKQIVSNGFPKKKDILLSTVGSIGRSCVYEKDKPIAFQRSVTFIRLKDNNNPYFYRYFIESDIYQNQLNSYAKTSAQSGIYMGDILKTTTLEVPLDEQNDIVNYLNKQLVNIDKIVQTIEEQIELLKKAKQKLITEVVTGKIDVTNL